MVVLLLAGMRVAQLSRRNVDPAFAPGGWLWAR